MSASSISERAIAFPNIPDGDVKIVLSERPEDILMLNISVIAQECPFFKASLGNLEWSFNKMVTINAGKDTERSYKLLELDFDEPDCLPLLVGKSFETMSADFKTRREDHDVATGYRQTAYGRFAAELYDSSNVIAAYKIGFAMMYGLPIDFPTENTNRASIVIAVLVEFADAYGLLPVWKDKILGVIFRSKCELYDLIAREPVHYLRVACRFQSKAIFEEAMLHAVAIHDKIHRNCPDEEFYKWLREVGGGELSTQFEAHAREFGKKMNDIELRLPHIQPQCCGKIGAALQVGVAIFRDWAASNTSNLTPNHNAVIKIVEHDYDVAEIINQWPPRSTNRIVDLKFGHIHRAVENCFDQAHRDIARCFDLGRSPESAAREGYNMLARKSFWFAKEQFSYYANIHFAKEYRYPWEK